MAWTYEQRTGALHWNGKLFAVGYSGGGPGKNNPSMEQVKRVGPIPKGWYTISGPPYTSPTHGPFVLRLLIQVGNKMYNRGSFLIHGDSIDHPGMASEGCIIMARWVRKAIWSSGDYQLNVIEG